jgi:perosamine synthetase
MIRIPLASPNITEQDIDAVAAVLRSGMLIQGSQVEDFEKEIAAYLGVKNVVAVSNGTASLHLALLALEVGPGDEVIVPAFSYVATANVVEIVGATSVFVDIERDTFNIDVAQLRNAITPQTKAIIPVHEFGLACDISALMDIAQAEGLQVIEDAACALGAKENGQFVGTFGDIGSFSLHPRKAVTSGEGGFLTTNDDAMAEQFRAMRNHGISVVDGKNEFLYAGFNYRMTDFQAALVRGQFSRIDEIITRRNSLAGHYMEALKSSQSIDLPTVPNNKAHTWQTFHIVLDEKTDRDQLIGYMRDAGIGTNYGAQCIPLQAYYQTKYCLDYAALFPNALRAYKHGLALPIYEKLGENDIDYVAKTVSIQLRQVIDHPA